MQAGEDGGDQQQQGEGNGLLTSVFPGLTLPILPANLGPYSCHESFSALDSRAGS